MAGAFQLSLFDSRSDEEFSVRVSLRARRLTVRVHVDGRVEVVVPKGVGAAAVRGFVHRNRGWIDRKVAEMGALPRPPVSMPTRIEFAATDEQFRVDWRPGSSSALRASSQQLFVGAANVSSGCAILRAWLRAAAGERLAPRLETLAEQLGYRVRGVVIRRQRTRWGSCSSRGIVSLNCSLLFMNPSVVRYLMIHELVHLKHMNHSTRFWEAVEQHEPNYRELDRALLAGWRAVPGWVFKG